MKKLSAALFVGAIIMCSVVSCGDNSDQVVGKWEIENISSQSNAVIGGGLIFDADGNGSFYEDTSSILYFEDNNALNVGGFSFGSEYVSYDGSSFVLNVQGTEMLTMERKEKASSSEYEGDYFLVSGVLYDSILSGLSSGDGKLPSDISISISFEDGKSEVIFDDVFEYELKGKTVTLKNYSDFLVSMMDSDSEDVKFKLSGNTLKVANSKNNDNPAELKKVE